MKTHPHCAVRLSTREAEQRAIDQYLEANGVTEVARFPPRDDHELNEAICSGRFGRVIFSDLDALLTVVWKGHAELDRWGETGVRIELVESGPIDSAHWLDLIQSCYKSLVRWRRQQRRRQVIAAVILSVLGLLSMLVLFLLIPPAK